MYFCVCVDVFVYVMMDPPPTITQYTVCVTSLNTLTMSLISTWFSPWA